MTKSSRNCFSILESLKIILNGILGISNFHKRCQFYQVARFLNSQPQDRFSKWKNGTLGPSEGRITAQRKSDVRPISAKSHDKVSNFWCQIAVRSVIRRLTILFQRS
jgi:hypothetical protein